jgi:hypothetical protein
MKRWPGREYRRAVAARAWNRAWDYGINVFGLGKDMLRQVEYVNGHAVPADQGQSYEAWMDAQSWVNARAKTRVVASGWIDHMSPSEYKSMRLRKDK